MPKKTQSLYEKAKTLIPGGTQLLSKRPEMYAPEQWPAYYSSAAGCELADLDGNEYLDFSTNGIGACVLGYADRDVDEAVMKAIHRGQASTLNCPEEVELAELLTELHPWAKMVRYTRSGGEAMAVAVRIARAKTGREKVIVCGYHGWHDWYLAGGGHLEGLTTKGVPTALTFSVKTVPYNSFSDMEQSVLPKFRTDLPAAIVMEVVRNQVPEPNYLEKVRSLCSDHGIPLIFDEITSGFRIANGGAHLHYGVNPDIAVFAKAMSNGYPMAAIIGTEEVMSAAQDTFISSTSWTERIGPSSAIATIKKFRSHNVSRSLSVTGRIIQDGWRNLARTCGLRIDISGIPPLAHISFESQEVATLFTQEMLEYGILAGTSFYPTFAHKLEHTVRYLEACGETFYKLSKGQIQLKGPIAHKGFQRLT